MHTVFIDPYAPACCSYTDHLAMLVPGASDAELSAARAPPAPVQIAAAAAKPAAGGQLPSGAEGTAAAASLDELQRQLVTCQRFHVNPWFSCCKYRAVTPCRCEMSSAMLDLVRSELCRLRQKRLLTKLRQIASQQTRQRLRLMRPVQQLTRWQPR